MANFAALEARSTAAVFRHLANTTAVFAGGSALPAIFDAAFEAATVGLMGMASAQPMLTLPTASVPAGVVGAAVTVGATAYAVVSAEPDGTGITRLMLEVAA